jgi:hypothetical protein
VEVLRLALVIAPLAGCYSPELRDCVVPCANNSECAGDQTCAAGLCTSGDSCSTLPGVDSDISPPNEVDAGPADARPASPDAPPADAPPATVTITVTLDGPAGSVKVMGAADCTVSPCTYQLPLGPRTFQAVAGPKPFEKWTTPLCMGQHETCTATLTVNAILTARFH